MNKDMNDSHNYIIDLLSKLSEHKNVVYWFTNEDFSKIIYASPALEDIMGYSCADIIENYPIWHDAIVPDDFSYYVPLTVMHEKIAESGSDARYHQKYRILRPDGEIRWLNDHAFPYYDKQGRCIGLIGTTEDCTPHKNSLGHHELKSQLDDISNTIADFITHASHDLNLDPENFSEMANKLLTQKLNHQRDQELTNLPSPQFSNLKGLETLIIDDEESRHAILTKPLIDAGLAVIIRSHKEALAKLIQNPHETFKIVILIEPHFNDRATHIISQLRAAASLHNVMSVIAISSENFYDEAALAIQGGFYCAINALQPSTLLYRLNDSWENWTKRYQLMTHDAPLIKPRVLLIEDNLLNQQFTKNILLELAYDVDVVSSGRSALNLLAKNSYSVILLDISLPDMSGLDIVAEFHNQGDKNRDTPIIALTSHAAEKYKQLAMNAGVRSYLEKPFTPAQLRELLSQWVMPII